MMDASRLDHLRTFTDQQLLGGVRFDALFILTHRVQGGATVRRAFGSIAAVDGFMRKVIATGGQQLADGALCRAIIDANAGRSDRQVKVPFLFRYQADGMGLPGGVWSPCSVLELYHGQKFALLRDLLIEIAKGKREGHTAGVYIRRVLKNNGASDHDVVRLEAEYNRYESESLREHLEDAERLNSFGPADLGKALARWRHNPMALDRPPFLCFKRVERGPRNRGFLTTLWSFPESIANEIMSETVTGPVARYFGTLREAITETSLLPYQYQHSAHERFDKHASGTALEIEVELPQGGERLVRLETPAEIARFRALLAESASAE